MISSVLLIFFICVILIVAIIFWVFGCIGLMNLAKANNLKNPWLAFIPYGCNYILGKLGFEIYPDENEKNPTLTWVFFGLSLGAGILTGVESLGYLLSIAVSIFGILAYNKIYKYIIPEQATKYTILSFFFGAIPLFFNNSIIKGKKEQTKEATIINEAPESKVSPVENITKSNFCSACGFKLEEDAKFCPNCGNKIN